MKTSLAAWAGIAAATLVLGGAPAGWAWNGRTHQKISARACHNVPEEMKAWRMYAMPMIRLSIYPDIWKGGDPDEGPRHYIYLDAIRGNVTNAGPVALPPAMPADWAAENGSIPWITMAVFDRLVVAMRSNDWVEATRLAGTLGHYVGDLNMPLHVVLNFNGQLTGQYGLHIRWEDGMVDQHDDLVHAAVVPATLVDDPWQRLLGSLNRANLLGERILAADIEARAAVNYDYENDRYNEILWTRTGAMLLEQVTHSADDLASLWYTAWVRAGRPAIPPPPSTVPEGTVHGRPRFTPENLPLPLIFAGSLLFIGLVIVTISMVRISQSKAPPAPAGQAPPAGT